MISIVKSAPPTGLGNNNNNLACAAVTGYPNYRVSMFRGVKGHVVPWGLWLIHVKLVYLLLWVLPPETSSGFCNDLFIWIREQNYICSLLSKFSTARGLNTRFSLVGPTKVKACKSFVFSQKLRIVENKELFFSITLLQCSIINTIRL